MIGWCEHHAGHFAGFCLARRRRAFCYNRAEDADTRHGIECDDSTPLVCAITLQYSMVQIAKAAVSHHYFYMNKEISMAKEQSKTLAGLSVLRREGQAVSAPDRQQMIAENAYYRALNRGFQGGDPVEDWLTAEREISERLPRLSQ